MNLAFGERLDAPGYYHYVEHIGSKGSQFIADQILSLSFKGVKLDEEGLFAMRQRIVSVDRQLGRRGSDAQLAPQEFDDVQADWLYVPQSRQDRVILYLNGGGFCLRLPHIQSAMVARWCRMLNARAFIPHYRLAPEHPYPAAPDDCLAAYRWLLSQGIPASSIVICGDSAGGNLTLVTLMRARDAGLPMPAAAFMLSPGADFSASGRSHVVNEMSDVMFSLPVLRWFASMYLTEPDLHLHPTVSPLTGDFTGLPPLLFQAGTGEMLLDDSTRSAAKAHAAGVTVRLQVFEGMPHVFQYLSLFPETQLADRHLAEFLATYAGWGPVARSA